MGWYIRNSRHERRTIAGTGREVGLKVEPGQHSAEKCKKRQNCDKIVTKVMICDKV
jgi:hypothetical protein